MAQSGNTVALKSFQSYMVNDGLLSKAVEAIKAGEKEARSSGNVQSFEVFYKGFRQNIAIKSLAEQLKGVRELGRQIIEMDNQAKRDFINFDGEKFQFVAGQWLQMGVTVLRAMGWDEHTVTAYVKQYRQQIEHNELRIRKEAENIGTNKK